MNTEKKKDSIRFLLDSLWPACLYVVYKDLAVIQQQQQQEQQ